MTKSLSHIAQPMYNHWSYPHARVPLYPRFILAESEMGEMVSKVDGPRLRGWLCIEKRLWLGIVVRFGWFGWVSGIWSAGFTFVNCTTGVNKIIIII